MIYGDRIIPTYPQWYHGRTYDLTLHEGRLYELDHDEDSSRNRPQIRFFKSTITVRDTEERYIPFDVIYTSPNYDDREFILTNLDIFLMQEIL